MCYIRLVSGSIPGMCNFSAKTRKTQEKTAKNRGSAEIAAACGAAENRVPKTAETACFGTAQQYIRFIYLWSLVQFPVDALFSSKIGENPKKRLKTAVGQICTTVVKTVETIVLGHIN
ncbi:Hypothetical_protein [Hexamita inflata]|uniref:Hypothetical_protein n=1 Tax=Hexamita inflata TaxID=28002 RepID=A0AA86NWB9_9EUKA|nr:Hypothetical protein HINF_LOCUS13526 [Hexamita inflata]